MTAPSRELREIGKQVLSLATDRDLYRKLEADVIQRNSRLSASANPYLSMMRGAYTDATTMRLRRLFAPDANLSLRRLVTQISDYPEMLHDKLTSKELSGDLAELDRTERSISRNIWIRTSQTTSGLRRRWRPQTASLTGRIDLLIDCIKRYYWIVSDSYIDLDVSYSEDPLAVFRFALDRREVLDPPPREQPLLHCLRA